MYDKLIDSMSISLHTKIASYYSNVIEYELENETPILSMPISHWDLFL